MADPVFTLACNGKNYVGDVLLAGGTFTSDGGTYASGGFVVTPTFESLDVAGRSPDLVLFFSQNGFKYDYDFSTKKVRIRVATTAGVDAAEAEHSAAAVVAGARTGVRWFAIWSSKIHPNTDRSAIRASEKQ